MKSKANDNASNPGGWFCVKSTSSQPVQTTTNPDPPTSDNYRCIRDRDHGGDFIGGWASATVAEAKVICNAEPLCKSFVAKDSGEGGMKSKANDNASNPGGWFCAKST